MKRSRCTEEQIIGILRANEAGGMDVSEAKWPKAQGKKAKLKQLCVGAVPDNAALKGLLAKKGDARCQALGRSAVRSLAWRPDDDALRARPRELAEQRRRFGCRRLHVLLRGEGPTLNRKSGIGAAPPRKLPTDTRYRRRSLAQLSTKIPVIPGWETAGTSRRGESGRQTLCFRSDLASHQRG